jgi:hypothetical protein
MPRKTIAQLEREHADLAAKWGRERQSLEAEVKRLGNVAGSLVQENAKVLKENNNLRTQLFQALQHNARWEGYSAGLEASAAPTLVPQAKVTNAPFRPQLNPSDQTYYASLSSETDTAWYHQK